LITGNRERENGKIENPLPQPSGLGLEIKRQLKIVNLD